MANVRGIRAVVLLATSLLVLAASPAKASRGRRSDDPDPLAAVVSGHSVQIEHQATQIAALQAQLQQLQGKTSHPVGFHVRLQAENHVLLNPGQTLKFDNVLVNVASGYSSATGIFTAPVSGLYAFQFSAKALTPDSSGNVYLALNGNQVVYVDTGATMGTAHGVFHMGRGDKAWIEGNNNTGSVPVHLYSYDTTFTGFLVMPD